LHLPNRTQPLLDSGTNWNGQRHKAMKRVPRQRDMQEHESNEHEGNHCDPICKRHRNAGVIDRSRTNEMLRYFPPLHRVRAIATLTQEAIATSAGFTEPGSLRLRNMATVASGYVINAGVVHSSTVLWVTELPAGAIAAMPRQQERPRVGWRRQMSTLDLDYAAGRKKKRSLLECALVPEVNRLLFAWGGRRLNVASTAGHVEPAVA